MTRKSNSYEIRWKKKNTRGTALSWCKWSKVGPSLTGPSGTRKKTQWGSEGRQQGGACGEVAWSQITQRSVRQGLIRKFRGLIQGPPWGASGAMRKPWFSESSNFQIQRASLDWLKELSLGVKGRHWEDRKSYRNSILPWRNRLVGIGRVGDGLSWWK